ncbi:MAG TPA: hypothetical protein VKG25_02635 [Bryobacteraceae bacterium]|nr:hypothetical protein [Bryobacteraceae bacterium]
MTLRFAVVPLAALLLLSCAPQKRTSVFIDPSLEMLVPPDTTFILGASVDKIKDTPVYQRLIKNLDVSQLNDFTRKTGVDPRKDLWQVISVSNGKTALFMARGKFSTEMEPRLTSEGAQRIGYKGYTLLGNEQGAVLFMNTSTAVAGATDQLRQLIDRRGQATNGLPEALRGEIRGLSPDDEIWAASVGGLSNLGLEAPDNSNLANAMQVLKGIDALRLGLDVRSGLKAEAEATCDSEKSAKRVHDSLRGLIGFGRLNTPDNRPDLLQLYDGIKVTQDHTRTDLRAEISPDLVDRFLDLWLKRR